MSSLVHVAIGKLHDRLGVLVLRRLRLLPALILLLDHLAHILKVLQKLKHQHLLVSLRSSCLFK